MEIATLARSFPGRVRVGVGHGVQDWMGQVGERVASPMTLLREHLSCIGALLRGERVTFHGRYVNLDDVALDWPPSPDTELLAAAMGPKTLRLSGELASGTVITQGTTPSAMREAVDHVRAGAASRGGRARATIVTYLLYATGQDAQTTLERECRRWGFDAATDVGVWGSADEIATGARRWIDAGADTIVLQPPVDADIEESVRFVGEQVRPILQR
jgi:alkanesulfonate monooxygenase SsuD/methylene tetrahydromethanopterin reductase-like flavin-dependent oxidoreductase (luciferase family)